ncbi:MAG: glycosyltransferase family 4 protein [Armatimonadetes bacterium]|nr:glycosyltransferase family 4 protein [Armatimonadota bacterium]
MTVLNVEGVLRMRVAIISPVVSGVSGGYRKYMQELVPMIAADPRVEWVQVYTGPRVMEYHHIDSSLITAWPDGDPWTFPWLKSKIKEESADVVFVPTAYWLDCGEIPVVTMVRNTEPLMVPFKGNSLVDGFKNLMRARFARQASRHADRIIAVSRHVREFLVDRWGIPAEKIGVVYHGVEQSAPESEMVRPEALKSDRFIFTAGSIRPARGLEDVIEALSLLGGNEASLTLAIAGKVDDGSQSYKRRLDSLGQRHGVASRIVWLGQLDAARMAWCYRNCDAFVMTSRAEACPNTALEAMSHGCRIVSTAQQPMPEFFRDCPLYYEPRNVARLAGVISRALNLPRDEADKRGAAAVKRAAEFNWADTARRTVDELEIAKRLGSAR